MRDGPLANENDLSSSSSFSLKSEEKKHNDYALTPNFSQQDRNEPNTLEHPDILDYLVIVPEVTNESLNSHKLSQQSPTAVNYKNVCIQTAQCSISSDGKRNPIPCFNIDDTIGNYLSLEKTKSMAEISNNPQPVPNTEVVLPKKTL
mmetsp:Transcript_23699/g.36378  ORF Transcript_23699/g.36378 Transcript_23699/m.36378 type:complete len:147 (-) Transcript_23699:840-1280(-)|eukprot:CAMPEP_0170509784 /NCGR_PEP_ID=MMETSP0208-20121228/65402_1 /TAXON_ID=197538 /ORGANISM="Strombidium inclinatum, Strain S3" /LENGTH=146 /DNA_ID=CAMNT_0010793177 /DNA_START=2783 /DNA_END=3223 /DNA_ORIENTATION=+